MQIEKMTIEDINKGLVSKKFSDIELITSYFERIEKYDVKIQSFITLCKNQSLESAKLVDEKIARGEKLGLLEGIPIAIKDNICTNGIKTTCASKMLGDLIPPYDGTAVKKLKESGAIILGKANMDEFAMGSSTENSAFMITKNPWDLGRVPGGSSGGSGAIVSAGFSPLSYGSDTGGSVRLPASFCGVVGLKPTYGLVSRYGLIAFASSLDQIGPLSRTVTDCAIGLQGVAGSDPKDSTSIKRDLDIDYLKTIKDGIKGMKIGIPKEFFEKGLSHIVKSKVLESIKTLEKLGAIVEEFSLPITKAGLSAYYIVSSAEASSNLGRYDGVKFGYKTKEFNNYKELILKSRTEGFGDEVKRRIMLGTYVLSSGYYDAYYKKAMIFRQKVKKLFKESFEKYDLIISPTSPNLPFKIGEKTSDPLEMYLADTLTVNINLAGIPALSLPCGFSNDNLPIGIQFMANHFEEEKIFKAAYALEQELSLNLVPKIY